MAITSDRPFFSIILPVYNGEKFISETIQSILQQSFTSWELIIVNDGSTDKTVSIVEDFTGVDNRIKLLNQPNKKQPAARNNGINVSSGQWIAFIDADDLWLPAKLELQYRCITNDSRLDVVFSDGYTKYQDKEIRIYYHYEIVRGFISGPDLYRKMLFGNYIPVLSAVVNASWVSRIGIQDETAAGVEDHDYWLRLCRAGANFYGMKERLFVYRIHENNFSANTLNQEYLSATIRLKNFDARFLEKHEVKRFKQAYGLYLKNFRELGKREWEKDLMIRFDTLNLPADSMSEKVRDQLSSLKNSVKSFIRRLRKKYKYFLLEKLYFKPRKDFAPYKDRISTLYNNWLNAPNIKNYGSVTLSSTAKLNFFDRKHVSLDAQALYVGDFTRINFMQENSRLIAGSDVAIGRFCNFNIVGQLILGNNVLFNNYSALTCHKEIVIGDDSWFGEGVKFYDHNHIYKERNLPFSSQGYNDGKIHIGSNVWVGSNTVILQNVSIGDGCVIGANNVVYKSLPPNTLLKSKSMEVIDTIT